jgi:hypothetical protein
MFTGEGARGGADFPLLRPPGVATIAAALFGCDGEKGRKRKERGGGSHRRDLR